MNFQSKIVNYLKHLRIKSIKARKLKKFLSTVKALNERSTKLSLHVGTHTTYHIYTNCICSA